MESCPPPHIATENRFFFQSFLTLHNPALSHKHNQRCSNALLDPQFTQWLLRSSHPDHTREYEWSNMPSSCLRNKPVRCQESNLSEHLITTYCAGRRSRQV